MILFNKFVDGAAQRYSHFLDILRSQVNVVMRDNPVSAPAREDAVRVGNGAARTFASMEHAWINENGMIVAQDAWRRVSADLGVVDQPIPDAYHEFIFETALYTSRLIADQADRDVVAMANKIRDNAMRIDFYTRSGKTMNAAIMTVMSEDSASPVFRFVDRAGRNYKSTKQIRDVVRLDLIHVDNEVYIAAAFAHGHTVLEIIHPTPGYKWAGQKVALIAGQGDYPLYFDIRDEVFNPSSEARLAIPTSD